MPVDEQMTAAVMDELTIRTVLARYCQLCDDGAFDDLIRLFTTDGSFAFGRRVMSGRDELRQYFEKAQAPVHRGKHLTTNAVVDVQGEHAVASSDFVFLMFRDGALVPLLAGRYRDQLVRDGRDWLIERRDATLMAAPDAG